MVGDTIVRRGGFSSTDRIEVLIRVKVDITPRPDSESYIEEKTPAHNSEPAASMAVSTANGDP